MWQRFLSLTLFPLPLFGLVAILALTGCVGKTVLSPPAPLPTTTEPPPAQPSLPPKPPGSLGQPPSQLQPETGGAPEKTEAHPTQNEQGVATPPKPGTPSPPYQPKLGPAASLYNRGESHLRQGQLDKAEMFLERALRIEPRNPGYWHTMAEIRFQQGKKQEAIQCCLKSNSLAAGSSQLIAQNNALIARIQAAGQNIPVSDQQSPAKAGSGPMDLDHL